MSSATAEGGTVKLTEHDAHLWADRAGQEQASSSVKPVLAAWHRKAG
ncbi:hypothetical protein [Streptomyces piniterrae]|nr:hypothetical protein [Streptomyces piniterrae]